MTEKMRDFDIGLKVFHRYKDDLLEDSSLGLEMFGDTESPLEGHRGIYAAHGFFVCNSIPSFVGDSVSTFPTLQIARRCGGRHNLVQPKE